MLLRHQEATALLESGPDALVVVDTSGSIVLVNAQTEAMFGYRRDELLGLTVDVLLPLRSTAAGPERPEGPSEPRRALLDDDQARHGIRKSGESFQVEVSVASVRLPNGVLISNHVRDVTYRRGGEEIHKREKAFAERVNATKSRFLAAASHDLRQPLQSLGFYVALLQRETDDRGVSDLTERMTRPLESMGQILDSLLDISELESGAIRTTKRPVRLQALMDNAYEDNIRQATDKGLELSSTPTDCIAHSDPLLLQRALANLVSNAIQHSRSGSVTIRCVRGEGTVRMEVSDTGPGISADNLERIFEERYQVDNPERDRRKGMGLGLAIVKHLAALLGHRLCVVSTLGQGSVFAIEMPLVETMEPSASLASPVSAARYDRQPLVLFVDDDPSMIDATSRVLAMAGVRIQSALSGEEALALVRSGVRPDVLITDYRLPGFTGVELVRRLRDLTTQALPSIILTGDTSTKAIEAASLANCTVLHKPVDSEALLSCIAAC